MLNPRRAALETMPRLTEELRLSRDTWRNNKEKFKIVNKRAKSDG